MNHDPELQQAIERSAALSRQRREILAQPPPMALQAILEAPQPAALIHSFPEEDLFFLVQEIGPDDALPLLSLASNKQWEYFLDIDSWQRDRIDLHALVRWLDRLLTADPARFVKWFLDRKCEFLDFLLYHTIEVKIREHDQDPADLGDDFTTLDDLFYVRLLDKPTAGGREPEGDQPPAEASPLAHEHRKQFLTAFLDRLADFDHVIYQQVLLEMAGILPTESEEEAFRLRNVRLAEKGFLPFDEAVGVYQPLKPEDLAHRRPKPPPRRPSWESLAPVPQYPLNALTQDNLFSRSLATIADGDVLRELQGEFAALNNRIVAADQKTIRSREELAAVVRKACAYLSIGLNRLAGESLPSPRSRTAALIRRYPLADIFRVGYGAALELKWQAEKFTRASWFSRVGLPLSFWGEAWMGVLGGLLIKKPLFFANYENGVLYREFQSLADVQATSAVLGQIGAFDDLLATIAIPPPPARAVLFLSDKRMLLTLWARHQLNLEAAVRPVPLAAFQRFFETLWEATPPPRRIRASVKEAFLVWAAAKTGRDPWDISRQMGPALEALFNEIEIEYGRVNAANLDPRYLPLFLLAHEKPFTTH